MVEQTPKFPPFSVRLVIPLGAWVIWKIPPANCARCAAPLGEMLSSETTPFVASTVAPSGICVPAVSGLPFTSTVPVTGETSAETPFTGGGGWGPAGVVVVVKPVGGVVIPGDVEGVVVVVVVLVPVVVVGGTRLFPPTLAYAFSTDARQRVLTLTGSCWQAVAAVWRLSRALRHADLGLVPATLAGSFWQEASAFWQDERIAPDRPRHGFVASATPRASRLALAP